MRVIAQGQSGANEFSRLMMSRRRGGGCGSWSDNFWKGLGEIFFLLAPSPTLAPLRWLSEYIGGGGGEVPLCALMSLEKSHIRSQNGELEVKGRATSNPSGLTPNPLSWRWTTGNAIIET